jgi:trk system potassium uptake protein TrkA
MTRERPNGDVVAGAADEQYDYYVLGGGHVGALLARGLRDAGNAVRLVDERHEVDDVSTVRGDPGTLATLAAADIHPDATVVVATRDDGRNLRLAQLVRTQFDVERVRVLANAPDRYDAFADAGHEPVCATTALSDALADPSQ